MALTRLRIVGATAVCALMLAGTVSAGNVAPKAPQYVVSQSAARGYVRVADLFGESDEEKAARQQHEDGQDAQIRTLNDKVRDLEETVRRPASNIFGTGVRSAARRRGPARAAARRARHAAGGRAGARGLRRCRPRAVHRCDEPARQGPL